MQDMLRQHPMGTRDHRLGACAVATALFASRCLVMFALSQLTQGRELSDDAVMHFRWLAAPWRILMGGTLLDGQHPPLLPPTLAVVAGPLLALQVPQFYVLRLTSAVYEAALGGVFWLAACEIEQLTETRLRRAALLIVLPMGWVTSSVMAQDESLAALFFVLVLRSVVEGQHKRAVFTASIGVVAAKALLIFPLIALLTAFPRGQRRAAWMIGLAPLVVTYTWVVVLSLAKSQPLPFTRFTPSAIYCTNVWTLLLPYLGIEAVRFSSGLLTALACGAVLWSCRQASRSALGLVATCVALLLATFGSHYHINPEYFVLAVPGMLLLPGRGVLLVAAMLAIAPWSINFFSGVANAKAHGLGGAKAVFVQIYDRVFGQTSIAWLHALAIVATHLLTIAATLLAVRCALRAQAQLPPSDEQPRERD